MKVEKVTVSVPAGTLAMLERVQRRLGKTRSALVSEALAEWLRTQDVPDADRRYAEAYLRQPEPAAESEATAAGAVAEWARWE
jgi:metal-responsive CopG/Arc/MetJ family transcriptional regulator